MKDDACPKIKKDIVRICHLLHSNGYVAATGGNVSVRNRNRIFITPTGKNKCFLKLRDIVEMDLDGKVIRGNKKPSSEYLLHLGLYRNIDNIGAVIHSHPPYATAFAIDGSPLPADVLPESSLVFGKNVPLVPYGKPGTKELFDRFKPYLKEGHKAFLMQNHGVVTVAENIEDAFNYTELLESLAKIMSIIRSSNMRLNSC